MKKHFVFLFLAVIFLSGVQIAQAQPWTATLHDTSDFVTIQKTFTDYWQGKEIVKGKGWKQFKRWEWFWETRLMPDGKFPSSELIWKERQKAQADRIGTKSKKSGGEMLYANWNALGPNVAPATGYAGLGRVNCFRFQPGSSSILWACTAGGGLWKSTDAGNSWATSATDGLASLGASDVAIDSASPNIMYLATGDCDGFHTGSPFPYSIGVLKSSDGGNSWAVSGLNWTTSQLRSTNKLLISRVNSSIIIAATSVGIYKTINGGATWTLTSSASEFTDLKFKPDDPTVIYAALYSGTVYKSTNTGDSWTLSNSGLPTSSVQRTTIGVTPANPSLVYALISNTSEAFMGLYRSTNTGATWTSMSSTPNILAWNSNGGDTGGQGWYDLSLAVSPTNANVMFVGGVNVWMSGNAGSTWACVGHWSASGAPFVHADEHYLDFSPAGALYAGNDGGIYKTTNNGGSWQWLMNGLQITQFYKAAITSTASAYYGGAQDNGTFKMSGGVVTQVLGGDGMVCVVDYSNSAYVYAEYYNGNLYRSTNSGSTFTSIISGISETGGWVMPYLLGPQNPQSIYAGYVNVWKSLNRGTSWTKISAFSGTASLKTIAVAPSDSNTIYTGNSTTLYRTTNGGTAWTSITTGISGGSVTGIAVNPTNPQMLWVTVSGYSSGNKVFKSTNCGTNWTNISTGLPNVPTDCIIYQPGTSNRLYVGMDVGLYYIDDNFTSWQSYNAGLPNVIVADLQISSGKLFAATFGRGLWSSSIECATPPTISTSCTTGGMVLTASTNTAYRWSTGETSQTIAVAISGIYSVIATNASGCSARSSIAVTIVPLPNPTISGVAVVQANSIGKLYSVPNIAGNTYSWSVSGGTITNGNGSTTITVSWSAQGTGIVQITQANSAGCTVSTNLTVSIQPQSYSLALKVFLEGAFSSTNNSMQTTLVTLGFLPNTDPYFSQIVATSLSSIVDWIKLELRSSTNNTQIEYSTAALLRNDGVILGSDGSSPLLLSASAFASGSYFIVLKHRFHLGIMSANALGISSLSTLNYDFSSSLSQAYSAGQSPMKQVGAGIYVMVTGDTNADGIINATDRINSKNQSGNTGYINSDVDMNGIVNAVDRTIIANNCFFLTQVP